MPELPEVETVCNGLRDIIVGKTICKLEKFRDKLRYDLPLDLADRVAGAKILSIIRRAKYILINLSSNETLIIHLGMSGKLTISDSKQERRKHDHALFYLSSGEIIRYNDARRFGLIDIEKTKDMFNHKYFRSLGVEPLHNDLNTPYLVDKFKNRKIPIKLSIMDNSILVGVGNIYACESLYRSGISPLRECNNLSEKEIGILIKNIRAVLKEAIEAGGSTLKDYVDSKGSSGYFQHRFKVYGREGKPCLICQNEIERITQGGRSTFFCSTCQE